MKAARIRDVGIGIQPEHGQWDIVAVRLSIDGMNCDRCASSVEQRLGAMPGVISVRVDHQKDKAAVSFDPLSLEVPTILAAIEGLRACNGRGFRAEVVLSVGVALEHGRPTVTSGETAWH